MKQDRKLLAAIIVLIGLVVWLLIISIQRSDQINQVTKEVTALQAAIATTPAIKQQPLDGKTPVLGVDYFNGQNGSTGAAGKTGSTGQPGQTVVGPQGSTGAQGTTGTPGVAGQSAYDIAVKNGFVGTEQEWLDSLKVKGDKGDPASELIIQCVKGLISEKYSGDSFWQTTNIKCETITP